MLFCCEAKTQTNLVPNPGFEFYTQCPNNLSQTNYAFPWYDPNNYTSDYFNTCAIGSDAGIPNNFFGYQLPHQGNGYCGFTGIATCPDWCAEYIAVPLLQPLQAGKHYCVSFWLSLADSVCTANNMIGAYFDDDSITFTVGQLQVIPQIKFTQIFSDKINWVHLQSNFTAVGGEKYMAISLFDTTGVDTLKLCNNSSWSDSYYYIDDVSVMENDGSCSLIMDTTTVIKPSVYPNIFTPNNDGVNDVWKIDLSGYQSINCNIYNRWGNKIYETKHNTIIWDGRTTSGEPCSDGTYFYIIQSDEEQRKGHIQLIR